MTQQNREPSLNNLPSPGSPKALDERIIAHARAAAPSPQDIPQENLPDKSPLFAWNGPWLGGLASTAVLVVAILIAVPALRDLPSQERHLAADAADATPSSRFDLAEDAAGTADKEENERRQQALEEVAVLADALPAEPAPMVQAVPKPKRAMLAHSAKIAAPAREALSPTAPTRLKLEICGRYLAAEEADSFSGSDAQGKAISGLTNRGAPIESSERCYQALQKDCADCDWPPTLKEALEAYGNADPKTKTEPKTP